ncbi:MAG: bifunctional riboflavin kinase/FAD synthetase [Parasporobacterium sp.]|nr:bifunctional riboflavin kinase/FAD synthetase [Parasporobacterium sp.]
MKYITDLSDFKINNSIVTLGKFDGNHIGHQLLFRTSVSLKKPGDSAVIFTFDVQPMSVISGVALQTIQTHDEKRFHGADEGIDYIVEFPFNKETMSTPPEDFVKKYLVDMLGVKAIVVGEDFRFGKNRGGNVELLKELGKEYGFEVYALEKVKYKGREVSSTYIKEEIAKGNLDDVKNMLGTSFSIMGPILKGKQLGRTIGFPTINFAAPREKVLPPNGVYATYTVIDGETFESISNVGIRPTFDDGEERTVETNIFDFDRDVYGKIAEVKFCTFIRAERKFSSADELMEEIQRNTVQVKQWFEEHPEG